MADNRAHVLVTHTLDDDDGDEDDDDDDDTGFKMYPAMALIRAACAAACSCMA